MSETKRVLHVVGGMNRGGAETMIMNIYRAIDRNVLQFDFITHREDVCDYDEEIRQLGGRIFMSQVLEHPLHGRLSKR
ncbi:hypothetical protein OE903_20645 [Bacillus sp. B6(2022)]|nr:hypothetical protein [Bacillus sp. B6(2022)]